jgi:hypothetical protein
MQCNVIVIEAQTNNHSGPTRITQQAEHLYGFKQSWPSNIT